MTNLEIILTFFFEGLIWFIIFFIVLCFIFFIRLSYLHQKAKNYKCPKCGCSGCQYLDGYLSKTDGVVWHCNLKREVKNPFKGGC